MPKNKNNLKIELQEKHHVYVNVSINEQNQNQQDNPVNSTSNNNSGSRFSNLCKNSDTYDIALYFFYVILVLCIIGLFIIFYLQFKKFNKKF